MLLAVREVSPAEDLEERLEDDIADAPEPKRNLCKSPGAVPRELRIEMGCRHPRTRAAASRAETRRRVVTPSLFFDLFFGDQLSFFF